MADDSHALPTGPLAFIKSVIRDKAIENSQISVQLAVTKGQNYCGTIYRVAVTGKTDGKDETFKYIIKVAPSESSRGLLPLSSFYKREMVYYTELFPIYKRLQEEAGIPVKDQLKLAECFHAETDYLNEFIIFEDLKDSYYIPADRTADADYDHARCTLEAYGKLHALSFVLKNRQPEKFKHLTELITELLFDGSEWWSSFNTTVFKKAATVVNDERHKEILKRYENNVVNLAQESLKGDEFSVFSHSDCWTANLLFRYEGEKPVETCLLDFQIARYGPPTADILHYIFGSTGQKMRKEHYEDLLIAYHNTMRNHLKAFGYDIDTIYPWTKLKEQLVRLGIFGLIWGLSVPLVARLTGDEVLNTSDFTDFENSNLSKSDCSDGYREHICGVLEDFIKYGYVN